MPNSDAKDKALMWRKPYEAPFHLAGFPWFEQDRLYRRLPLAAAGDIPAGVNDLANYTAGGQIRFQSNTRRLSIKVALANPASMDIMTPIGQCGFDLYVGVGPAQRFCSVTRLDPKLVTYESVLFEHTEAKTRAFTINFPICQAVKEVLVGLDSGAEIAPPPPYAAPGKIVIYGTSIVHGCCATRPGMAHTNILSRALNMEVVNLGFAGSGRGEPEVARLVAAVPDPRLFILDYEPNCADAQHLRNTMPEFIRILRAANKDTPILVVSRIPYAQDLHQEASRQMREECRAAQAQMVEAERAKGDARVHFFDGSTLLGEDGDECTVDGVHPTDLGFWRMAKGLEPAIRRLLGGAS